MKTTNPRKAALKMIDDYFFRLERVCESSHDWDRYIVVHEQEEKNHSRFIPDGVKPGLTHKQSIRLFAVKCILERLASFDGSRIFTPEAKDFFHIKQSIFAACALFSICEVEITKAFTVEDAKAFLSSVDYAALNKPV